MQDSGSGLSRTIELSVLRQDTTKLGTSLQTKPGTSLQGMVELAMLVTGSLKPSPEDLLYIARLIVTQGGLIARGFAFLRVTYFACQVVADTVHSKTRRMKSIWTSYDSCRQAVACRVPRVETCAVQLNERLGQEAQLVSATGPSGCLTGCFVAGFQSSASEKASSDCSPSALQKGAA